MRRTLELHPEGFHTPSGDAQSWYTGALGEIAVAGVLEQLGSEWTVLHSVPIRSADSDIDHVVIGPAGVFTINTKSHARQKIWIGGYGLLVSGNKTNYVALAIEEARFAEERLSLKAGMTVPIVPAIALVNPGPRTVQAEPEGGVRVVADWELLELIRGQRIFSDEQVQRIVAAAVRPETWHRNPVDETDGRDIAIQFNAIMARALQGAGPAPSASAARRPTSLSPSRSYPTRSPITSRSRKRSQSLGSAFVEMVLKLGALALFLWFFVNVLIPMIGNSLLP